MMTYCAQGTVLSTPWVRAHLILTDTFWGEAVIRIYQWTRGLGRGGERDWALGS